MRTVTRVARLEETNPPRIERMAAASELVISRELFDEWWSVEVETWDGDADRAAFVAAMRSAGKRGAKRVLALTPEIVAYLHHPNGAVHQHDDLLQDQIRGADSDERARIRRLLAEIGKLQKTYPKVERGRRVSTMENCPYTPGKDVAEYMTKEHAEVEELLQAVTDATEAESARKQRELGEARQRFEQFAIDLEQHLLSEERDIFPVARKLGGQWPRAIDTFLSQHPPIRALVAEQRQRHPRPCLLALGRLRELLGEHRAAEDAMDWSRVAVPGGTKRETRVEKMAAHTELPRHFFHTTSYDRLPKIAEVGLRPRQGGGVFEHGGYDAHSQGKVFLAAGEQAALSWFGKVADMLEHTYGDDAEPDRSIAVLLRVMLPEGMVPSVDPVGDRDVRGSFEIKATIPPDALDFYDPTAHAWCPVAEWEEADIPALVGVKKVEHYDSEGDVVGEHNDWTSRGFFRFGPYDRGGFKPDYRSDQWGPRSGRVSRVEPFVMHEPHFEHWTSHGPCRDTHYTKRRCPISESQRSRVYVQRLPDRGGYKVWLVNGTVIRNEVDTDFIGGGNPGRYGYVPEGELWLDASLPEGDIEPFLVHELVECNHMIDDGMSYDDAHELATKAERVVRDRAVPRRTAMERMSSKPPEGLGAEFGFDSFEDVPYTPTPEDEAWARMREYVDALPFGHVLKLGNRTFSLTDPKVNDKPPWASPTVAHPGTEQPALRRVSSMRPKVRAGGQLWDWAIVLFTPTGRATARVEAFLPTNAAGDLLKGDKAIASGVVRYSEGGPGPSAAPIQQTPAESTAPVYVRVGSHRARAKLAQLLGRDVQSFWRSLSEDHWYEISEEEWARVEARKIVGVTRPKQQPDPTQLHKTIKFMGPPTENEGAPVTSVDVAPLPGELVTLALKTPAGWTHLYGIRMADGWVYSEKNAFSTTGAWDPARAKSWKPVTSEERANIRQALDQGQKGKVAERAANLARVEREAERIVRDAKAAEVEAQAGEAGYQAARQVETRRQIDEPWKLKVGTVIESPDGARWVVKGQTPRSLLVFPLGGSPNDETTLPIDRPARGYAIVGPVDQVDPPLAVDQNTPAEGECSLPMANACAKGLPIVRIGLPYGDGGRLLDEVHKLGAPTLLSVGSMFRDPTKSKRGKPPEGPVTGFPMFRGFTPVGAAAWTTGTALDSAGFTAMLAGGYRWSPADYVDFVVTNRGDGAMPFPWTWWSAMDYCVEPKIAPDRAEVERRMQLTVSTYGEILDLLNDWRREGVNDVPDPLPVLQGRTAEDYAWSAKAMAKEIDQHHECSCPFGGDCEAEWHRTHAGLPALVGVGSVCRRELHGPEGLLTVLKKLDEVLPGHVKLHLFGVKGSTLSHLGPYLHRVHSIDSLGWDFAAREETKEKRRRQGVVDTKPGEEGYIPSTVEHRADVMRRWSDRQQARVVKLGEARAREPQVPDVLFHHPEQEIEAKRMAAAGQIVHAASLVGRMPSEDAPADHTFWFPGGRKICLRVHDGGWSTRNTNPATETDDHQQWPTYAAAVEHVEGLGVAVPVVELAVWQRWQDLLRHEREFKQWSMVHAPELKPLWIKRGRQIEHSILPQLSGRGLHPLEGHRFIRRSVDKKHTAGESPDMTDTEPEPAGELSILQRKLLERFVTGKKIETREDVLAVLALVGATVRDIDGPTPKNTWRIPGKNPILTFEGEEYPLVMWDHHHGYFSWESLIKLAYDPVSDPSLTYENNEKRKKAEQKRRRQAIERWKQIAKNRLGGRDPKLQEALLKYAKGQSIDSAKLRTAVLNELGATDEERKAVELPWMFEQRRRKFDELPWEQKGEARKALEVEFGANAIELQNAANLVTAALRKRAAALVGYIDNDEREARRLWRKANGFERPQKPKGYKLGVFTCGWCFEEHAINPSFTIVHHGYRRPGVGYIIGDCHGVNELPWERGYRLQESALKQTLEASASRVKTLHDGFTKLWVHKLDAKGKPIPDLRDGQPWVNPYTGKKVYEMEEIFPGNTRWAKAEVLERRRLTFWLISAWGPDFGSIPWTRMAIRTWQRHEQGPVGAPEGVPERQDYAGKPPEADDGSVVWDNDLNADGEG